MQALAAAADGGEELVEIRLEGGEDAVGPVLHLEPRLAGGAAGLVDDLLRLALGELHDLGLRGLADGLLARLLEQPVLLALGLGEHLLALLHDPARLLDLFRDRRAHLVEDVVDLLAVDPHLVGERHRLRVVDEVVELVDQYEDIHQLLILLLGVEGGAASPFRKQLLQAAGDGGGDEVFDISSERGDLLHSARGDEADLRARHHVHGLDLRARASG